MRSFGGSGSVALAVVLTAAGLPACDPETLEGAQETIKSHMGGCDVEGRDVMVLVETSQRMAASSGFAQGSRVVSRFELARDTMKKTVPQLKSRFDFGLITFPYVDGSDAPVCPTSCGTSGVVVDNTWPYGQLVSTLEHVQPGGLAATGEALAAARAYFAARPAANRVRSVLLFAAGGEECGRDAVAEATALREMGVAVYVFTFAGVTDPRLADIAAAGGAAAPTDAGTWTLIPGAEKEIMDALDAAAIETCDGADNDCDGLTDEELVRACPCGSGMQECRDGDWGACLTEADFEAGLRDLGSELCDGADNDCDGEADEGFDIGGVCTVSTGACVRSGSFVCTPDRLGVTCDVEAPVPVPEVCDGEDNDCDGEVDEGISVECTDGCGVGHRACVDGALGSCVIEAAAVELCDGEDNDCDGEIDEDFAVGDACSVSTDGCGGTGRLVCSEDGSGTVCEATGTGSNEVCNGADDDCDGRVDEGADICGDGMSCYDGQCVYD